MRLAKKVGRRLRRASDPTQLGDPVRQHVELEERLNDGRGNGIVTAPGTKGGLRPLVVPTASAQACWA